MTAIHILNQWNETIIAFQSLTGRSPTVCVIGKIDFEELSAAVNILYGSQLREVCHQRASGPGQYQLVGVSIYVASAERGYFFGMEPEL